MATLQCPSIQTNFGNLGIGTRIMATLEYQPPARTRIGKAWAPSVRCHLKLLIEPEGPHTCETCEQQFRTRTQLSSHIHDVHKRRKEKPFKCSFCASSFNKPAQKEKHESKRHGGERGHKCRYCRRLFGDARSKNNHERLHTGEKPHECLKCGSRYRSKTRLREHVKTQHTKAE